MRFSGAGERFDYTVGLYYFLEDVDRFETFDSSPLAAPGLSRPTWNASNETTSYAVFGETSYDVSDTLSVTLGARWTYDEKEFDNVAATPDLFGFLSEAYTVSESEDWGRTDAESGRGIPPCGRHPSLRVLLPRLQVRRLQWPGANGDLGCHTLRSGKCDELRGGA